MLALSLAICLAVFYGATGVFYSVHGDDDWLVLKPEFGLGWTFSDNDLQIDTLVKLAHGSGEITNSNWWLTLYKLGFIITPLLWGGLILSGLYVLIRRVRRRSARAEAR